MERRSFLLSTAASYPQIVGANDRARMGNIATGLKRTLEWDAAKEKIHSDAKANRRLSRPYRKPWVVPAV